MGSFSNFSGIGKRSIEEDGGEWVWDETAWKYWWKEARPPSDLEGDARLDVSFTDASFLAVLDNTFSFASTTQQFVLNSMLVSRGISV